MLKKIAIIAILSIFSIKIFAGILAESSRIIYLEGTNQKSLMLVNTNKYPIFTQTWVDDGEGNPDFQEAPFVVLPSVFTLKSEEIKGVNIIYNGMELPKDRESVFWLNLYEIPAVSKAALEQDYLNLAMNTQLKIFYRPKSLKNMDLSKIQKELKFKFIEKDNQLFLKAENPSPYHINIMSINILNEHSKSKLNNEKENMISPFSDKFYKFENIQFVRNVSNILEYILIDDVGYKEKYSQEIK